MHLSKSIECTTARVNPHVTYGFWEIMMCLCRFIITNRLLWCGMLVMGEVVCVGGGREQ